MRDPSAHFLAFLAAALYVVLSVMPQGTALCLGGGHEWGEVIVTPCPAGPGSGGGHQHAGSVHAHPHSGGPVDGCQPGDCAACEHHAADHHGPCTDIPIDADEGRTAGSSSVKMSMAPAADLGCPASVLSVAAALAFRAQSPVAAQPHAVAMREVAASLRAVIQRR
jgi:hypothetical protein